MGSGKKMVAAGSVKSAPLQIEQIPVQDCCINATIKFITMKKAVNILVYFFLFLATSLSAQNPTNYPTTETEPVHFNTVRIILYIVVPILIIVGYILLRRMYRKKRKDQ